MHVCQCHVMSCQCLVNSFIHYHLMMFNYHVIIIIIVIVVIIIILSFALVSLLRSCLRGSCLCFVVLSCLFMLLTVCERLKKGIIVCFAFSFSCKQRLLDRDGAWFYCNTFCLVSPLFGCFMLDKGD